MPSKQPNIDSGVEFDLIAITDDRQLLRYDCTSGSLLCKLPAVHDYEPSAMCAR